jgi:hypothetical protein
MHASVHASMYVCTYVRTYVCMYIFCMYVCMYVRMYVCTFPAIPSKADGQPNSFLISVLHMVGPLGLGTSLRKTSTYIRQHNIKNLRKNIRALSEVRTRDSVQERSRHARPLHRLLADRLYTNAVPTSKNTQCIFSRKIKIG